LSGLRVRTPNDLVSWTQTASKAQIAALAPRVFDAAKAGSRLARQILDEAAGALARDAVSCAGRVAPRGARIHFVLSGSVLLQQPSFTRRVTRRIHELREHARVTRLRAEAVWGAVAKARAELDESLTPQGPRRR
jgi:N-acetylglucosamine kinase-like BadF-type ATPase